MNKSVLILGSIIVLAVIVMFAFGFGNDKTQDAGGGAAAVQPETESKAESAKTGVETIRSKLGEISLSGKTGPGETVEAFEKAVLEKRYDDAMGYISSSHRMPWLSSKWDLAEYWPISEEVRIVEIEYLDTSKTMAEIQYETEQGTQYLVLGKEDNAWKIVK